MFEYLKSDVKRYLMIDGWEKKSFIGQFFVLFFSYGLHATIVHRFGTYIEIFKVKYYTIPVFLFLNLFYMSLHFLIIKMYGISIDRAAKIGKGFYVGHFGGIRVGKCEIGNMCNIHQLSKIESGVIVGNYVWIGAHAVLKEGVILEDHATVTVAAEVKQTVAAYTLVAGSPARTIKINFDNNVLLGL